MKSSNVKFWKKHLYKIGLILVTRVLNGRISESIKVFFPFHHSFVVYIFYKHYILHLMYICTLFHIHPDNLMGKGHSSSPPVHVKVISGSSDPNINTCFFSMYNVKHKVHEGDIISPNLSYSLLHVHHQVMLDHHRNVARHARLPFPVHWSQKITAHHLMMGRRGAKRFGGCANDA